MFPLVHSIQRKHKQKKVFVLFKAAKYTTYIIHAHIHTRITIYTAMFLTQLLLCTFVEKCVRFFFCFVFHINGRCSHFIYAVASFIYEFLFGVRPVACLFLAKMKINFSFGYRSTKLNHLWMYLWNDDCNVNTKMTTKNKAQHENDAHTHTHNTYRQTIPTCITRCNHHKNSINCDVRPQYLFRWITSIRLIAIHYLFFCFRMNFLQKYILQTITY